MTEVASNFQRSFQLWEKQEVAYAGAEVCSMHTSKEVGGNSIACFREVLCGTESVARSLHTGKV